MKLLLAHNVCFLLALNSSLAMPPRPQNSLPPAVKSARLLHFNSINSYLHYHWIASFQGRDSALRFYNAEYKRALPAYTDYLPLTGGTLTGSLAGTDATFSGNALTVSGNNPALNAISSNASLYSYLNLAAGSTSNQIYTLGQSYNGGGYLSPGALLLIGATTGVNMAATGASGVIRFYTGGVGYERMKIEDNGNVGIGTSSPPTKLSISTGSGRTVIGGTSSLTMHLDANANNVTIGDLGQMGFGVLNAYVPAVIGYQVTNASAYTYGDLLFATRSSNADVAPLERLRITSGGAVGIGRTSNARVTIGTSNVSALGAVSSSGLQIDANDANKAVGNLSQIGLGLVNAYTPAVIAGIITNASAYSTMDIVFATRPTPTDVAPTERLRITNGGAVGIGTTNPAELLSVGVASSNQGVGIQYDNNTYGRFGMVDPGANNDTYIGSFSNNAFRLYSNSVERMRFTASGNVGIGTTSPTEKLSVNGNMSAKKIIVTNIGWSDYVFGQDYKLISIGELETYIRSNKHLPDIPTEQQVKEHGVSLGDNQALLLKKIEELTLYVIQQQKEITGLHNRIKQIETKKSSR